MNTISCEGFWSEDAGSYQFSLSPIFSYLIRECGRLIDDYNADILYDFTKIEDYATKVHQEGSKVFWMGFREFGVDHEEFIKYRIESPNYYRSLYKVIVTKTLKKSVVELVKTDAYEFKKEHTSVA